MKIEHPIQRDSGNLGGRVPSPLLVDFGRFWSILKHKSGGRISSPSGNRTVATFKSGDENGHVETLKSSCACVKSLKVAIRTLSPSLVFVSTFVGCFHKVQKGQESGDTKVATAQWEQALS